MLRSCVLRHSTPLMAFVVLLTSLLCLSACDTGTSSGQVATPIPPTATQAPPTPTPSPTPVPSAGPAVLGGLVAAFTAKYGPPDTSTPGMLFYENKQITVIPDTDKQHVIGLIITPPGSQDWDKTTAESVCTTFAPADAKRQKTLLTTDPVLNQQNGFAEIERSAALAQTFPASYFTDQNANRITPGTFTISYEYDQANQQYEPTKFIQCSFDLGIPSLV